MAATRTATKNPKQLKGKRRLQFDPQPFRGKTIFLDLPGYKNIKQLEQQLTARGAVIEKFLDQNVRYFITNRSKDEISQSRASSGQSPRTPSTGGNPFSIPSPSASNSQSKKLPPTSACTTRAQRMLRLSLEKQQLTGHTAKDTLSVAIGWKCKVLQVKDVEAELKKLKDPSGGKTSAVSPNKTFKDGSRVRKLIAPFFKAEDLSRQYRPIVFETSHWPVPIPTHASKHSPFDNQKKDETEDSVQDFEKDEKRSGYCECCSVHYKNLQMHLKSSQHRQYAENDSNFRDLDELIRQHTTFEEFVMQLRQQAEKARSSSGILEQSPAKVVFVSPPSTPAQCSLHSSPKKLPARVISIPDHLQSPQLTPTRRGELCLTRLSPDLLLQSPDDKVIAPEYTPGFTAPEDEQRITRKRKLELSPSPPAKHSKRESNSKGSRSSSSSKGSLSPSTCLAREMALQEFVGSRISTRSKKNRSSLLKSVQNEEILYWKQNTRSPRKD